MAQYVALLRGITPGIPNMANAELVRVCKELGLQNVRSVLASGNIIFEADGTTPKKLEALLEDAWLTQLDLKCMTIVKSQKQIQSLVDYEPFPGLTHGSSSYLLASFLKQPQQPQFKLPHQPEGKTYTITGYQDGVLFTVTDNTVVKTTDLMTWLERKFGKAMTSRSWNTVLRIHKQFQAK